MDKTSRSKKNSPIYSPTILKSLRTRHDISVMSSSRSKHTRRKRDSNGKKLHSSHAQENLKLIPDSTRASSVNTRLLTDKKKITKQEIRMVETLENKNATSAERPDDSDHITLLSLIKRTN